MASKLGQLTIGIAADLASLRRDMAQSNKIVKGSMDSISRSAKRARNNIAGLAAGIVSIQGFRALVRYSDEYTSLNNRLRLASKTSEDFAESQKLVFNIAQDTRQALGSTAELYQRLALSTRDLDLSQSDLGDIVETVNQSLVISGASSQAASAAIVQLGQGLAAGALRGQEFNSIAEQAPRLMQALADALGVNIGKLRDYSKEGKLTAKVIVAALKGQSQAIAKEFNETQLTVDQSLQKIQNSFTKLFGEGLEGAGATRALTGALDEFNKLINDPAIASALTTLASAVVKASAAFVELSASSTSFVKSLAEDVARLTNGPATIQDAIKDLAQLASLQANLGNAKIQQRVQRDKDLISSFIGFASVDELQQQLDTANRAVQSTFDQIGRLQSAGRSGETLEPLLQDLVQIQSQLELAISAKKELEKPEAPKDNSPAESPKIELGFGVNDKALKEQERQLKQVKSALAAAQPPLKKYLDSVATAKSLLQAGKLSQSEYNNALAIYKQRFDEASGANKQWNEDVEDAARFAALAKTELEKLNEELARSEELAKKGLISDETLSRTKDRIAKDVEDIKEAGKEINKVGQAIADGMQDVVSDGFVSIWKGGFDEVLANFGDLLINLAAEAAAADFLNAIGFGGKDNQGGNLTNLFDSLFSFDGGGYTGSGSRTGGLDGRGGFLAMVHPNETVVDHTKGQSMGNSVSIGQVVLPNVTNSREATKAAGAFAREVNSRLDSGRRYS